MSKKGKTKYRTVGRIEVKPLPLRCGRWVASWKDWRFMFDFEGESVLEAKMTLLSKLSEVTLTCKTTRNAANSKIIRKLAKDIEEMMNWEDHYREVEAQQWIEPGKDEPNCFGENPYYHINDTFFTDVNTAPEYSSERVHAVALPTGNEWQFNYNGCTYNFPCFFTRSAIEAKKDFLASLMHDYADHKSTVNFDIIKALMEDVDGVKECENKAFGYTPFVPGYSSEEGPLEALKRLAKENAELKRLRSNFLKSYELLAEENQGLVEKIEKYEELTEKMVNITAEQT